MSGWTEPVVGLVHFREPRQCFRLLGVTPAYAGKSPTQHTVSAAAHGATSAERPEAVHRTVVKVVNDVNRCGGGWLRILRWLHSGEV